MAINPTGGADIGRRVVWSDGGRPPRLESGEIVDLYWGKRRITRALVRYDRGGDPKWTPLPDLEWEADQ